METTAQIDLSGISPLCDFPFTIISLFDVNSCKQSRGILRNHTDSAVSHASILLPACVPSHIRDILSSTSFNSPKTKAPALYTASAFI